MLYIIQGNIHQLQMPYKSDGTHTALGQNYTLKDKKLVISLNEWMKPIISQYPAIEKEYNRQEPRKDVAINRQKEVFASLSPMMRD
ncbi:MAG: hypothetical protein EXS47_00810 [Candidatus Zambryskibacteria bacterium]|nr:hypothetical protein [Candidatus Zambryskibacteria bacterium]